MMDSDGLSSIFGWMSIACWVVVYSPQIYENYALQSGEGLSVLFVLIWLLGDLCNLSGALLADLLPTIVFLALYYASCDMILLGQIYYYRRRRSTLIATEQEQQSLLGTEQNIRQIQPTTTGLTVHYVCATCFVIFAGVAAWWLSENAQSIIEPEKSPRAPQWLIQSLGWTSALSYLGARFPQILKNFKTRCEGLSPALFFFAIIGNTTYTLSICAKSMDRDYLMLNAAWLAGSALTVFLDILVVMQFLYYSSVDHVRMSPVGGN